ncbi:hypothetical protein JCM8097_000824 [Rhodosporidiobolus ruineniae]
MSTPKTPDDLSPSCNLCDLPAELKARIVELCADQDERFKEWVKSRPNVGAELKQKQTWHGRSVSALFRVSKEFNTHAAPYLFRVLKASKFDLRLKCADPTLRHLLFRELNLDSAELGKLTDIIAILPQLVGVKKLVISDKALRQLWGGEDVTFDELSLTALTAQYSAAMFKRLCHLEEISTTDVSLQKLSPFVVNSASTLRILRLIVPVHAIQWFSLGEILSSSTALQELNIDFKGDRTSSLSPDLALLRPYLSTTPPLRTLFLSSDFLNSSCFDFCTSFSSTLEHLSLTTTGGFGRGIYSGPQLTTHTFPHVTHFALEDYSYTLRTLQSIRPSHFPSLAKLTFSVVDLEDWEETPFPLRALNLSSFPTLTTLSSLAALPPSAHFASPAQHAFACHTYSGL